MIYFWPRFRVPALLTLSLLFGLGCGGGAASSAVDGGADAQSDGAVAGRDASDTGGEVGVSAVSALEAAWCPILSERFCTAAKACGCSLVPGFGESDATCRERVARGCKLQLARFQQGVVSGDLSVPSALPAGCVPALEEALTDCHMPDADLFAVTCPLAWPSGLSRDLPAAGEACVQGLCAEGTRCDSKDTCARPQSAAACSSPGDCPGSELCGGDGKCAVPDLHDNGVVCTKAGGCTGDVLCLASGRRACATKVAGAACTSDAECIDGEFCGAGGCEVAPGEGVACGGGVACATGLACRFATGVGEGTCQALPKDKEPCALGPLGPVVCSEGLACRDRFCGAIPGDGEPCAGIGPAFECKGDLGCHFLNEKSLCGQRVGEGAACGLDDSCEAGLFCDFSTNTCTRVFAEGAACRSGNECGAGGACVPSEVGEFRCVRRPGLGAPCFLNDSCEPGLACASPYETGVCAPRLCTTFRF